MIRGTGRRLRRPAAPGHDAVELDIEREAEERPNQHDEAERGRVLERLVDGDGEDDVGDDQHFEAEEDRPAHVVAERRVRAPGGALDQGAA